MDAQEHPAGEVATHSSITRRLRSVSTGDIGPPRHRANIARHKSQGDMLSNARVDMWPIEGMGSSMLHSFLSF